MKKHLYELTNEELEKYVDTPEVQRVLLAINDFGISQTLLNSYCACIMVKTLLEQQIEVVDND